jgi:hypothetical protein
MQNGLTEQKASSVLPTTMMAISRPVQRRVASALIAATKARDVGAQIFFLSTAARGYQMQRLLQQLAID